MKERSQNVTNVNTQMATRVIFKKHEKMVHDKTRERIHRIRGGGFTWQVQSKQLFSAVSTKYGNVLVVPPLKSRYPK